MSVAIWAATLTPAYADVVVGKTYTVHLGMILSGDDVIGPDAVSSPDGVCVGIANMNARSSKSVPTFEEMRRLEPGYDEVRQGAKVKVVGRPWP